MLISRWRSQEMLSMTRCKGSNPLSRRLNIAGASRSNRAHFQAKIYSESSLCEVLGLNSSNVNTMTVAGEPDHLIHKSSFYYTMRNSIYAADPPPIHESFVNTATGTRQTHRHRSPDLLAWARRSACSFSSPPSRSLHSEVEARTSSHRSLAAAQY